MALSPRIELRQSQLLVMTPQLMQAIKLLQLSNLDLIAYVEAELERNPLLERASSDDDGAAQTADETDRGDATAGDGEVPDSGADWMETSLERGEAIEAKLDTDLGNIYQDDHGRDAAETAPAMRLARCSTTVRTSTSCTRSPFAGTSFRRAAFASQ